MSSEHAPQSEIVTGDLLCSPDTLCRYIFFIVRWETGHASSVIGFENIRIHPSTRTLSDSLRIHFFPLWRADLFFSGFAVEFAGCVWTVAVSGKKKLRIRKYPDTCGRGLSMWLALQKGVSRSSFNFENLRDQVTDLNWICFKLVPILFSWRNYFHISLAAYRVNHKKKTKAS